jgi:hypothetical protein
MNFPVLYDEGLDRPCKNPYRGEKILYLHRDVRDTLTSMVRLRAGQTTWCEHWVPQIIRSKLAREESFRERYTSELSSIERLEWNLLSLAALYWKYKTEAFFTYQEQGLPVFAVSYERLVTNPRATLHEICGYLGIPFIENLLCHHQLSHTELFANGFTVGDTDPFRPIQSTSVGQWKRFLSAHDVAVIEEITAELSRRIEELFSPGGIAGTRQSASLTSLR